MTPEELALVEKLRGMTAAERYAWLWAALHASIAQQIKSLRLQRHWTQKELAARAGTDQETVSRYERPSNRQVTVSMLRRFARAFDVALHVGFQSWANSITWVASEMSSEPVPSYKNDTALRVSK